MEFLILFILSLIPRLIFLFYGMPSITHDEADYFLNSYFLAKTGSDFWNNKFFLTSGILNSTGGIPVYFNSIFYFFLEKNIVVSRLIYGLMSVFTPIIIYLIVKKITKNRFLSSITFLIFNFSPWYLHLSTQAAVEQIPSLFLFFLGFYLFLFNNIFIKLLSFISLFLSFHSYMGIKLVMPFYIFIIQLTKLIIDKKKIEIKLLLKLIFITAIIYIVFITPIIINNKNLLIRANDTLTFLNKNYLENKVWYERLTFNGPEILKKIYSNKLTVIIKDFLEKYFEIFNLKILFINGDPHAIYGSGYSLFYFPLIFFFIYGFIQSLTNFKNFNLIIIIFILFSPFSIAFNNQPATIALRAYPLLFAYSYLIALGIESFLKNNLKLKTFYSYLIYLFIFFSFINYILIYNFRLKIINSEQWHLGEKKLFEKVLNKKTNQTIYIVNNEPKETFMLFSFYHLDDAFLIKNKLQKNDYTYKNLVFTDKKISELKNGVILIKRGIQDVDKLIENKLIFYQPYLEASDKSGILYYKL
ncbi:MAG: hypothetical protein KatS3mg092_0140 [Patescibacteria group bacterium]|nr:MAG: hypothetical protein KatS3mg092_0140 [Patescibacteria group bacterium]